MSASKLDLTRLKHGVLAVALLILAILPACYMTLPVSADGLGNRSLRLLNSTPGATTDYTLTFTLTNTSTIGSLSILFCANSPLQDDVCPLPTGLDVTHAVLSSQGGIGDFTLFTVASNYLLLSRTPTVITAPQQVTLKFSNIVNPSSAGSYYARLAAYSSTNGTGTPVDYGGLALATVGNLQISSVVPPYLTFCAGLVISTFDCSSAAGDYINFGNLSPAHSSQADSQMVVATNAPNGYVIQVYGTTMTSGNNLINAMVNGATSSPGSSQFGINLRANTAPPIGADPTGPGTGQPTAGYGNPNHYRFVSNDTVVSALAADNFRKYTVSYVVNTPGSQPPGVYASTLSYVAAGSF